MTEPVLRIAQLSDLHLGYSTNPKLLAKSGVNLREQDGYMALHSMVSDIIESGIEHVLICGDVFHAATPPIRAIVFMQKQLQRFAEAGVRTYILAGNHDTNDVATDVAASLVLDDRMRHIYSFATPYNTLEIVEGVHLHMVSHHLYAEQEATMSSIAPVDGEVNIFATHGSVIDPILHLRLRTHNSPREIVIPDSMLEAFSWNKILLGHIHERGFVGSKDGVEDTLGKGIFYNGSLIRRGFSDGETVLGRGWTQWDLDSSGSMTPTFHQVAQRPQFDLPLIDGAGLSSSEATEVVLANLRTTFTDEEGNSLEEVPEFDPATAPILRQRYVNLSASTKAGMDQALISAAHAHAFSYSFHMVPSKKEAAREDHSQLADIEHISANDVLSHYDDWLENSAAYASTHESLRAEVREQTRAFIEQGRNATLTDD